MNDDTNPLVNSEADELLAQLTDDPGFISAHEAHEEAACELDEDGECPMCFALEAVHVLFHASMDLDPIDVIHSAKNPADHLRMAAVITQWLAVQAEDYLEFMADMDEDNEEE